MKLEELIEEGVYTSPLALLSIKDKDLINRIDNYLPYSIGIEIECGKSSTFNIDLFKNIPDIMSVNIDDSEQRFRIPNGLRGLICLYNLCQVLAISSEINLGSGHHYHVDMTNTYHLLSSEFVKDNRKWILDELDSWEYKGNYNKRDIEFNTSHNWVRFQSEFKTAEFRIGNMTFDYTVIVRRLIHACSIIRKLNKQLVDNEDINFVRPNIELLKTIMFHSNNPKLLSMINRLSNMTKTEVEITDEYKKEVIKNRIIKI